MKIAMTIALGATAVVGVAVAAAIYANWNAFVPIAAMGINYVRYLDAPKGELTVETAQRVGAATGLTEVLWPTEITTAKVSVLGLAKD